MFVNGSAALKQVGGQLKQAGAKAPGLGNAPRVSTPSVRKHKKMLKNTVEAYGQVSAIDTAAHEARTGHLGDLTTKLAQEGHHNISITTEHGNVTAQSKPRKYTGPAGDSSVNPSADVHGDPHAGAPFHQGGYYSGHTAHTDLARPTEVYQVQPTAISASATKPAASSSQLALPAPAPRALPAYAPVSKNAPFTATAGGNTFVPGQSPRPDSTKKADGPERKFVVGKQGPLHTRETTPGNESKPIAKIRPLNTPYGGPDDGKKKKRTRKPKDTN